MVCWISTATHAAAEEHERAANPCRLAASAELAGLRDIGQYMKDSLAHVPRLTSTQEKNALEDKVIADALRMLEQVDDLSQCTSQVQKLLEAFVSARNKVKSELPGQLESLAIPLLVKVFGWTWEGVEHLSVRGARMLLLPYCYLRGRPSDNSAVMDHCFAVAI